MSKLNKVVCALSLLGLVTPTFASTIQCKRIPNTSVQECTSTGSNASALYGLTNMPYALCSKALCTLNKHNAKQARCTCLLYTIGGWKALSISPSNYSTSKPTWNKQHRLHTVQSNYSLANVVANPNQSPIRCAFKNPQPWADCFGVRCMVTSKHTATCLCPVYKNKVFGITGPGNMKKCLIKANQAWSGILFNGMKTNSQFVHTLYYQLYPNAPVSQHRKR